MLEYGIKTILTNPTLITKSTEIIRLIDTRNHETRAFVLPILYAPLVEKLSKDLEFKLWVQNKKKQLNETLNEKDDLSDVMNAGIESMNAYLEETP
jgi:hypothetical protein